MEPIEFKDQNSKFAEDQEEYKTLPALKLDTIHGEVISCWKLSFKERIKVLLFGKVWLSILSFNKPLPPSFMSVNRKDVYKLSTDDLKWYIKLKNYAKNKAQKNH